MRPFRRAVPLHHAPRKMGHSIPILSPNPSPCREAAAPPERKGTEAAAQSAVDIYREIIKDNIDYHILKQDMKFDSDRLDEIVDLMLETVCTARKRVRIAGDDYPAELVKSKFMKLDGEHIRFVLDCMRENTTKIRNIKQYLKAALFNAPSTIGNYYTCGSYPFVNLQEANTLLRKLFTSRKSEKNVRQHSGTQKGAIEAITSIHTGYMIRAPTFRRSTQRQEPHPLQLNTAAPQNLRSAGTAAFTRGRFFCAAAYADRLLSAWSTDIW